MPSIINTLNESNLHNSLKNFYAINTDGQTEIKENGYIYDIITKNNEIIEIQTKNLSKLLPKIYNCIDNQRKIKIVYPLVITKEIYTYDEERNLGTTRKSPVKNNIYDIFSELTGIYPILTNDFFILEVIEVNIIEERIKTTELVQSRNKRRRYPKNWNKQNKKLKDIISTHTFKSAQDYLNLLPASLPEPFCAKDIELFLKQEKKYSQRAGKNSHLILWVLNKMGIITHIKTEKRIKFYSIG